MINNCTKQPGLMGLISLSYLPGIRLHLKPVKVSHDNDLSGVTFFTSSRVSKVDYFQKNWDLKNPNANNVM